jgi:hypothetical protein
MVEKQDMRQPCEVANLPQTPSEWAIYVYPWHSWEWRGRGFEFSIIARSQAGNDIATCERGIPQSRI